MKSKEIFLVVAFFSSTLLPSQTLSRFVMSVAGRSDNPQLQWTLGEVSTTTLKGGDYTIVQGFQQPLDSITTITSEPLLSNLSIFPNPARSEVWINLFSLERERVNVQIFNMLGQEVRHDVITNADSYPFRFDLGNVPSGIYLIKVAFSNNHQKILKLIVNQ